jgi:alkanesulfonate monooxygenase SsuD/methylene tetrahydromethanopterin reductase-like flavin-dependent oxidoreductase (luciferase family)
MQVGMFHQMWALSSKTDRECIEEALSDVILADELGFESFWFGEHHYNRDRAFFGRVPIPELVIARFAAETRRIRLGTGVKVLPYDDAARFAESMTLLDILSEGRAHYGVGMAVRAADTPDHDRGPKFREQLSELVAYLNGDCAEGRPALTPAPERDLTGLLWVAAREPATVQYAAKLGLNFVVGQAEQAQQQRTYVDVYRASGGEGEVRGARMVYVAPTDAEAYAAVEGSATTWFNTSRNGAYYRQALRDGRVPDTEPKDLPDLLSRIEYTAGSPETVAAGIRRYMGTAGVDRIDVMMHTPGMSQEAVQRSMRLFATEVAPLLGVEMQQASPA